MTLHRHLATTFLVCALGASAGATRAAADATQTVALRDGTSVTGEVLEYVEGDHVTLKLANGDRRRIEWIYLATPPSAPRIETAPAPLPLAPPLAPFVPPAPPPGAYRPGDTPPILPDELRPETELTSSTSSASRLSFGALGGINSPFGDLGLAVDYFPIPFIGVEGVVAMPIEGQPVTFGESVVFEWPLAGGLAMGIGAGLTQTPTKTIVPGDHPGLVNFFTGDATHVAYSITPHLTVRATMTLAFALNNSDYCKAHPEACPQVSEVPLGGVLSLFWNFNFGGGGE